VKKTMPYGMRIHYRTRTIVSGARRETVRRQRRPYGPVAAFLIAAMTWPTGAAENVQERMARVIRHVSPAFVFIAHGANNGSGAVISADGYIITNQHVVGDATELDVRLGTGKSYKARVVGRHAQGDIALLKISDTQPLPFLKPGDSDRLQVGDLCLAVGNPAALGVLDQTPTITSGVISGLNQFKGGGIYNNAIVMDAAINPGNSGGPLINMRGELIGMNGLVETRLGLRSNSGIGYAIPVNQIRVWFPHLRDPERMDVYRGRFLGLKLVTEAEKAPDTGALVSSVAPDSDAARSGLQEGDLIVRAQGMDVWNPVRFVGILNMLPAGTTLQMEILRDGRKKTLQHLLSERRPADFGFVIAKPDSKDAAIKIESVKTGSAAEKAGLKAGDVIAGIGEQPLTGPAVLQYAIMQRWQPMMIAGAEIVLKIRRQTEAEPVEMTVKYVTE
jgi:serine protease Do